MLLIVFGFRGCMGYREMQKFRVSDSLLSLSDGTREAAKTELPADDGRDFPLAMGESEKSEEVWDKVSMIESLPSSPVRNT